MKKYIKPTIEVTALSQEILDTPGMSPIVGEGEFGNQSTFEEEISGESPATKNLWDE